MSQVLLEALVVVLLGAVLAVAANGWRTDGLQLTRDYFPRTAEFNPQAASDVNNGIALGDLAPAQDSRESTAVQPAAKAGLSDPPTLQSDVAARLAEKGLSAISHEQALALWRDPMFQEYGATLFLDARRAENYKAGHIPGSWHFDPFYPERTLDALLPMLSTAVTVVVYCKGGECDDSESAALYLINLGAVDGSRLSIYAGGMAAWESAGLPLERGERGSGEVSDDHAN